MLNVVLAYGVGWAAIAVYLTTLVARQRSLERNLDAAEAELRATAAPRESDAR